MVAISCHATVLRGAVKSSTKAASIPCVLTVKIGFL